MQIVVIIGVLIVWGIVWIIGQISSGVSGADSYFKANQAFKEKRAVRYSNRVIDVTKALIERNEDIVQEFESKVEVHPSEAGSYRSRYRSYSSSGYYIENLTRDCINEIALAEDRSGIYPGSEYLSNWKPKAVQEWQELATVIEKRLRDKQSKLMTEEKAEKTRKEAEVTARADEERKLRLERWKKEETIRDIERSVERYEIEFNKIKAEKEDPQLLKKIHKRKEKGDLRIEDISLILAPDLHAWSEVENELISKTYKAKPFPLFSIDKGMNFDVSSIDRLNTQITEYNDGLEKEVKQENDVRSFFKSIFQGYASKNKEDVVKRFNFVLNGISLPTSIPKIWDLDFDAAEGILIAEVKLPDIVHNPVFKEVALKSGNVKKVVNSKEQREIVPNFHPALMLRVAYEIFRNDLKDVISLLVLNGWVEFNDPATGNLIRTYTASLAVKKDQVTGLKLSKLDPAAAFTGLKGKSAGKIIDIVPIEPMLVLNREDKRFVQGKDVLDKLGSETNLASMDWQEFEHLIREMFEKEFSGRGAEVKITQASRDKGVDAVIFDPNPIHGGKFVIQAKRYANTVDVSAVRDLCAVVRKEGASRGILVTTSTFGADAYAFAQNEPVTLLNGAELLGLLKKHGYTFKIDLVEARRINASV